MDELPLLELFTRLRAAGLPLGIDEYKLLLRSLQAGFGRGDNATHRYRERLSLKRLCQTLWVKSSEYIPLFNYYFDLLVGQMYVTEIKDRKGIDRTTEIENKTASLTPLYESTNQPITSLPDSELLFNIEDELEIAKSALKTQDIDEEISVDRSILLGEYFPVNRRQMKQIWRYLRRPIREGSPVELDIEATVNKIGREGILQELVLVPRRVNRAELMLLIDRDGSMVPFHALSQRLAETAVRGGRLGKAGIYYFHNCPIDYIYGDRYLLKAEFINDILSLIPERTAVLIFSDAGAARGGYNRKRVEFTEKFIRQLKTKIRYIAWLNPLPKNRWNNTSAGAISRVVPMFEMSRSGLQQAINVLRGRH